MRPHSLNHLALPALIGIVLLLSTTGAQAVPAFPSASAPIATGEFADEKRVADSTLADDLVQQRDGVLANLTQTAANVLSWRLDVPKGLPGRFLDFAQIVWAFHKATDQEDLAVPTLRAWQATQALAVGDADPLLAAILEFGPKLVDPHGLMADRLTASEVAKRMEGAGDYLPRLGGGKAIARNLRELRASLALAGWTLIEKEEGEHRYFSIRRAEERNQRNPANSPLHAITVPVIAPGKLSRFRGFRGFRDGRGLADGPGGGLAGRLPGSGVVVEATNGM